MKALSVRQPWVHCIFHCGKDVENRTFRNHDWLKNPPLHLVGQRIAIHATASFDSPDNCNVAAWLGGFDFEASKAAMPTSAIVGTVRIAGLLVYGDEWNAVTFNQHGPGPIPGFDPDASQNRGWLHGPKAFVLQDKKLLPTPIPCAGQLGFWQLPGEVLSQIPEEYR